MINELEYKVRAQLKGRAKKSIANNGIIMITLKFSIFQTFLSAEQNGNLFVLSSPFHSLKGIELLPIPVTMSFKT